jgi:hypothetical protein
VAAILAWFGSSRLLVLKNSCSLWPKYLTSSKKYQTSDGALPAAVGGPKDCRRQNPSLEQEFAHRSSEKAMERPVNKGLNLQSWALQFFAALRAINTRRGPKKAAKSPNRLKHVDLIIKS